MLVCYHTEEAPAKFGKQFILTSGLVAIPDGAKDVSFFLYLLLVILNGMRRWSSKCTFMIQ